MTSTPGTAIPEPSATQAPKAALAARPVPTSRSFSIVFVLSLVICLVAAVGVNLLGDGTKLFPSPGFPPSTSIRAWKARRLARLAHAGDPPRALVIGSSRVLPLREADVRSLTGLATFNFGVSVGCPVDYLAELRFALDAGLEPQTVVLGLDELAFGDNPEADLYDMQLVSNRGLFQELDLREQIPISLRILTTVSVQSTGESLRNLWRRSRGTGAPPWDGGEPPEAELEGAHLTDWETLSPTERRARLTAGVDRMVEFWGKYLVRADQVDGMRPTRRKLELFERFLDLAASRGVRVFVALLPVHPDFERRTFSPRLLEIRAQLAQTLADSCRRRGFRFRDETVLASFGGEPDGFEDGTHMTPRNGRLLLADLLRP
jgi:hypothetical protein